jgi:MerR family transcriptional regulator, thiopeptide resistance regulator
VRLYLDNDVERLYRICLFRRLGLPLGDIERALDDPEWSLHVALATHLSNLEQRLEAERKLRSHLVGLVEAVWPADEPHADDLLKVLEEMTMLDTIVQRRISILVYSDLEAANDYLIRVFGLGPDSSPATTRARSSTGRFKPEMESYGSTPRPLSSALHLLSHSVPLVPALP